MARRNGSGRREPAGENKRITQVAVCGYKSIGREQAIEVRPLTILAGANSSGKSSMMQPLLLLKQTLEAPYDPGALLLSGPNIKFTSTEQMLFRAGKSSQPSGIARPIRPVRGNTHASRVGGMWYHAPLPANNWVFRPARSVKSAQGAPDSRRG